ncbi:RnfH family protein [Lysobacteraceae bacterium NML120232]|nr:RnfH family protein [Xanthomonadaceae bacterium NML120232]
MKIEVLAVWPECVESRELEVNPGICAAEAAAISGLLAGFPLAGMAVFGKRASDTTVLHEGDRLELLRALVADPKQSRRKRAEAAAQIKKKPAEIGQHQ